MVRYAKYKKEYNKSEFSSSSTTRNNSRMNNNNSFGGGVRKNQTPAAAIVCLQCRKPGHKASRCPERKGDEKRCCYRCGSTEHSLHECDLTASVGLPFAKCFVCGGQGHLSGACPENPKGLYPNGGGCKVCGDVRHFVKDCPLKTRQDSITEKAEDFFSENDDYDEQKEKKKPKKSVSKVKVVEFK